MKLRSPAPPVGRFDKMALAPELLRALDGLKIAVPTDIQKMVIPTVLRGDDVIAIAQTGSGKTLAYALSVLTRLGQRPSARALILAPSREMAHQIQGVFLELCADLPVTTCLAIGGVTGSKQASQMRKNPRLIVATPGRLNDHLLNNKLLLQGVESIVIDEADRMLDMGFAPQLKSIQRTLRGHRQTLMFSASFGKNVESIAELFMRAEVCMLKTDDAEKPVERLMQKVLFLSRDKKRDRLLDELNATTGGVIVFTGNRASCEDVAEYLKSYGFISDMIHGDLTQGYRNRVVRDFRSGKLRILVTTDLLARGIDVPHVDHVINFDLPYQTEDFLHRIGRTARAGRSGHAITFVTPFDTRSFKKIQPYLAGAEEVTLDSPFEFVKTHKGGHRQSQTGAKPRAGLGKRKPGRR